MKTIHIILVALFVVPTAGLAWAQDGPSIAYVDLQRAIREVEDGQEAIAELEEQLEERQTTLDDRAEALRQLTDDLEAELVMLDDDAREARMLEYQEEVLAYQEQYLENQRELMVIEQEATREILERMLTLVAEIGEERGYSMVFEKTRSSLVWADNTLDITDDLIERYEERY